MERAATREAPESERLPQDRESELKRKLSLSTLQPMTSANNTSDVPDEEFEESTRLTDEELDELTEAEPEVFPVTYSGQDFDVAGLVRRMGQEDILIPTFGHEDDRIESAGFQRSFVWRRPQMDRFIESLLLGYPIPGIFLVRQTDRRYLVLDGQQRLRTLQYFYEGLYEGRAFSLRNVAEEFKGMTYKSLPEKERRLLDDTFIQATIVVTDGSIQSLEAIYQIFERVNAGGTPLTPHEIRVALYAGPFIDFLANLNQDEDWRNIYGKVSPRLRDQELVLRILALYERHESYERPLKSFLNSFVADYRESDWSLTTDLLEERFGAASELLAEAVGRDGFIIKGYQINAALTEAIFVGMMRRLDDGPDDEIDLDATKEAVERIRANDDLIEAVSRATADPESVRTRLSKATAELAEV